MIQPKSPRTSRPRHPPRPSDRPKRPGGRTRGTRLVRDQFLPLEWRPDARRHGSQPARRVQSTERRDLQRDGRGGDRWPGRIRVHDSQGRFRVMSDSNNVLAELFARDGLTFDDMEPALSRILADEGHRNAADSAACWRATGSVDPPTPSTASMASPKRCGGPKNVTNV